MNAMIEQHKAAIASLCETYGVRRLDVFGSAAREDFDSERSDFDFILDFQSYGPDSARRFISLADALEGLLGRRVDIVFERAMKPRFREFVATEREVVFERAVRPVAA